MTETTIKYGVALNSGDKLKLCAFWTGVVILAGAHIYILLTDTHLLGSESTHAWAMLLALALILFGTVTTSRTSSLTNNIPSNNTV